MFRLYKFNGTFRKAVLCVPLLLLLLLLLAGCVSTHVASQVNLGGKNADVQRVAIAFSSIPAGWKATNIAGTLGARNLTKLAPHLRVRIPALFAKNGLQTRLIEQEEPSTVEVEPGEYLVTLRATHAYYSSRTGQALYLQANMLKPGTSHPVWTAEISLTTLGFGQFDESVADSIAEQMLFQLRRDKVVARSEEPILNLEGKPVDASPGFLHTGVLRPRESGFAKVDDVAAVPFLTEAGRLGYQSYLNKGYPRAFSIAPNGAWGWASGSNASARATENCEKKGNGECSLYSVDGKVVWTQ